MTISDEAKQKILEMRKLRHSYGEIATALNLTRSQVAGHIGRNKEAAACPEAKKPTLGSLGE